jgi:hypothetical protein
MKEELKGYTETAEASAGVSRRQFLNYAGIAGAGLLIAGCKDDDDNGVTPTTDDGSIDLGSNDAGVMNYAYALEQLEYAFYARACETPFEGITRTELELLKDIRDHELAHREFFRKALGANAIPDLEIDLNMIDFKDRTSVLATARTFEDLGIMAYNGVTKLLVTADNVEVISKIVSVEGRHAAYIHELLLTNSFASTTDAYGLEEFKSPDEVLAITATYIKTKLSAKNLPTD